jgi:hypothetical protein
VFENNVKDVMFLIYVVLSGLAIWHIKHSKYKYNCDLMKNILQSILSYNEYFSFNEITDIYKYSNRNLPLSVLSLNTGAYDCKLSDIKDFVLNFKPYKTHENTKHVGNGKKIILDLNKLYYNLQSLEREFKKTIEISTTHNNTFERNYDPKKIYYLKLKLLNDYCRSTMNGRCLIYNESVLQGESGDIYKILQLTLNNFFSRTKYEAPSVLVNLNEFEQYLNNTTMECVIKTCVDP